MDLNEYKTCVKGGLACLKGRALCTFFELLPTHDQLGPGINLATPLLPGLRQFHRTLTVLFWEDKEWLVLTLICKPCQYNRPFHKTTPQWDRSRRRILLA